MEICARDEGKRVLKVRRGRGWKEDLRRIPGRGPILRPSRLLFEVFLLEIPLSWDVILVARPLRGGGVWDCSFFGLYWVLGLGMGLFSRFGMCRKLANNQHVMAQILKSVMAGVGL